VNLLISNKHSLHKNFGQIHFLAEIHDMLLVVSYEREAFFISNM